jgi:hypothetical protein
MYSRRWELIQKHLTKPGFVLVDWGSDAGWFSVKVAHDFPESTVVSVEAGIMTHGQGLSMHEDKLKAYNINNNIIVNSLFGPDTYANLHSVRSDYQLVLSVFHHMGDGFGKRLNHVTEWDTTFCDLVRGSNVTFFEVPNESDLDETPHRIREWYNGREVETVIRSALEQGEIKATVEELGETQHGTKGTRKLFKISIDQSVESVSGQDIAAYIDSVGKQIMISPYRRFKMFVSRLLHKCGLGSKAIVSEHKPDSL